MPWPEHWCRDRLNADILRERVNHIERADLAFIGVPDSLGFNAFTLDVCSPFGARFYLHRDVTAYPGAGATEIAIYLQIGGLNADPLTDVERYLIGTLNGASNFAITVAHAGRLYFEITVQQGAAKTGRLLAVGL